MFTGALKLSFKKRSLKRQRVVKLRTRIWKSQFVSPLAHRLLWIHISWISLARWNRGDRFLPSTFLLTQLFSEQMVWR